MSWQGLPPGIQLQGQDQPLKTVSLDKILHSITKNKKMTLRQGDQAKYTQREV